MNEGELTREALRAFPLPEQSDAGKDDHGRLLIVAGSRQVPGSALLSAACVVAAESAHSAVKSVGRINMADSSLRLRGNGVRSCERNRDIVCR